MSTDSRLSSAVAHLLHWSLPASPLFLAILMLLAHAPYAAPIVSPSSFYLACMLGALLALVTLPLRPWGHRARRTWCVGSGIALEAAWIVLLVAEQQRSAELLLLGSALAGCSSACLLVLWLWVDQASEAAGEVTKLAGAFGIAYLTYTFFSVVPHAGVVSYLFPLLTCPPLFVDLGNEPPNATETAIFWDGKAHKFGPVDVEVFPKPDKFTEPWHFVSQDGRFDFTMTPFYDHHGDLNVLNLLRMH